MGSRKKHKGEGSGISVDLGAILGAVGNAAGSSGVAPNPDMALQGPTPSGAALGETQPPFKATNIFAKPRVAELNSQYLLKRLGNNLDVNSAVDQATRLILPHTQEQQSVGDVANKQKLELERGLTPIETDRSQKISDIQVKANALKQIQEMLTRLGVIPTDKNIQDYDVTNSQQGIQAQRKSLENIEATQGLGANRANLENEILNTTRPTQLSTGNLKAQYENQQTAGQLQTLPAEIRARDIQAKQAPAMGEAKMLQERAVPGHFPIVDLSTGKPMYTPPPTFQEQMMQKALGGGDGSYSGQTMKAVPESVKPAPVQAKPQGLNPYSYGGVNSMNTASQVLPKPSPPPSIAQPFSDDFEILPDGTVRRKNQGVQIPLSPQLPNITTGQNGVVYINGRPIGY